jgi:hypothetical protein
MKLVTASANRDLDQILDLTGISLQLTPTQFQKTEKRYRKVGEWLHDDDSPVAMFDPSIFPQGSLLLDTTVKPLSHTEFDLDLVCLLHDIEVEVAGIVYPNAPAFGKKDGRVAAVAPGRNTEIRT